MPTHQECIDIVQKIQDEYTEFAKDESQSFEMRSRWYWMAEACKRVCWDLNAKMRTIDK